MVAVGRGMLAVALTVVLGCAPLPLRPKFALLCTAPNGQGFSTLLDPAADYATYSPFGGTMTSILRLEDQGGTYALRNGYGVVVVLDRASGIATVHSEAPEEAGTFACRRDPSRPTEIPEPRRR
jgi:hypothetical protein